MASKIKVNNIQDTGSNDIITSDGVGNITLNATLDNFTSTGIDDNATSTAITIDSSENVGIGTSSPTSLVHASVPSGSQSQIRASNTGNTGIFIFSGDSSAGLWNDDNTPTLFATNSTERMRIDSSGSLLHGTTSTSAPNGNGGTLIQKNSSGSYVQISKTTTEPVPAMEFYNPNGRVGQIIPSGTSTSFTTSSDYRLKENVIDLDDATTRVKQLQPKRFNFIADADTIVDGFLAHEVSSIVPEAITGTHNEVEVWKEGEELPEGVSVGDNKLDDEGNTIPIYQGIDQSKLVPLLTASLKEAIAKIETLESTVADLTTRIETLENA